MSRSGRNRRAPVALEQIETELRDFFAREARGEAAAYLFGSVARGEATADSDVDVAILFANEPPPTLDGLGLELEAALERLLRRPVELLVLNRASAVIVHRVLRDSRLVSNRDPSARVRFEVAKRAQYFDLQPILRRYWKLEERPVA